MAVLTGAAGGAPLPCVPDGALDAWCRRLGPENVVTDPGERARWGRRTFGPAIAVGTVLRPGSCDDVSAALRIATAFAVPVHPVSRGANWGLGSRAPTQPGAAILDLSRMTAIADYDPEQGVVRVEPGVTFRSLADYLAARNSRFFVPEIGGSPEASVLANALDRGDGAIGDRWASLGDLTVVLADGRIVETGFSAAGAHRLRGLHAAAGPIADGLFSQSNLGVVAGAAVRLEPMPGNLAVITGRVDSLDALPGLIAAWREAQITGAIRDRSVTMWNGVKFLARDKPRAAYAEAAIRQAESETWLMSGYLEAETAAMLSLRSAWVLQRVRAAGGTVSGSVVRTRGNWLPGCEGYLGKPSPRNLRTVYWSSDRVPAFDGMDPDEDGCGLLWLCLAFPFDGECVRDYVRHALPVLRRHGIDLNIGLEAPSFRCLLSYISLSYRRTGPESDAAALQCYRDLLAEAETCGLAPYRLANGAPHPRGMGTASITDYLAQIRAIGDPEGVLSAGRSGIG